MGESPEPSLSLREKSSRSWWAGVEQAVATTVAAAGEEVRLTSGDRPSVRPLRVPTTSRARTATASSWLAVVAGQATSITLVEGATAVRAEQCQQRERAWTTPRHLVALERLRGEDREATGVDRVVVVASVLQVAQA